MRAGSVRAAGVRNVDSWEIDMKLATKSEDIMERWLWVCPWVGVAGAIVTFWFFGLSLLAALGIAFLLSCPAVGIWTWRESSRVFGERDRLQERLTRGSGTGEKPPPKP